VPGGGLAQKMLESGGGSMPGPAPAEPMTSQGVPSGAGGWLLGLRSGMIAGGVVGLMTALATVLALAWLGRGTGPTFLGATGITPRWEVSNSDLDLAALQRRILSAARESHLLADHTKFGRTGLAIVSPLKVFSSVITDAHLSPPLLAQLRKHVRKVLIAR